MRYCCFFLTILLLLGACKTPNKNRSASYCAGLGEKSTSDCTGSGKNAEPATSPYNLAMDVINTQEDFHHIVLKPDYFKLKYPGYVIGVEKINRKVVGTIGLRECTPLEEPCIDAHGDKYTDNKHISLWIESRFSPGFGLYRDWKSMTLTHIAKFGRKYEEAQLIYNLYGTQCVGKDAPQPPLHSDMTQAMQMGWEYLRGPFKTDLKNLIADQKATHVFVFSMGWNTPQWTALANFDDLYRNLVAKANEDADYKSRFRPVFIGITWPSYWGVKPAKVEDYPNKSMDADEVGITIANLVIHDVIGSIKKELKTTDRPIKTVLVGHSLGARVVTRAADSGYLITEDPEPIDLVVCLESAFGAERFLDEKNGAYHMAFKELVANSYYATSSYDWAIDKPSKYIKKYYMGADVTFHGAQNKDITKFAKQHYDNRWKNPTEVFEFAVLNPDGTFKDTNDAPKSNKIVMVDASAVINETPAGTGGGGHNDIYSPEIGLFLWKTIKECTFDKH